jgi:transcriptional regulator with XRE-family HTH domain
VRWLCRQHHQLHHATEQRAGNLHPMTIARRLFLTEHREAKGISAEAMAGRLGIARESVYRIERDPWRLNGRKQLAYATALQIKPEDLWNSPHGAPHAAPLTPHR